MLKGAQERIRAEARERREQLREAQRLQARAISGWETFFSARKRDGNFSWRFSWDLFHGLCMGDIPSGKLT